MVQGSNMSVSFLQHSKSAIVVEIFRSFSLYYTGFPVYVYIPHVWQWFKLEPHEPWLYDFKEPHYKGCFPCSIHCICVHFPGQLRPSS